MVEHLGVHVLIANFRLLVCMSLHLPSVALIVRVLEIVFEYAQTLVEAETSRRKERRSGAEVRRRRSAIDRHDCQGDTAEQPE